MGKAPPCALYKHLLTLSHKKGLTEGFWILSSKQEMDNLKKDLAAKRKPNNDLMGAVRTASTDMLRAAAQRKKQAGQMTTPGAEAAESAQSGAGSKKTKTKAPDADEPAKVFVAMAMERGSAIAIHKEGADGPIEPAAPLIIQCSEETVQALSEDEIAGPLKLFLQQVDRDTSMQRTSTTYTADSPIACICAPRLMSLLPPGTCAPPEKITANDQLKPLFLTCAYSIADSWCCAANLKSEIATIWYISAGQRDIVAVKNSDAETVYAATFPEDAKSTRITAAKKRSRKRQSLTGTDANFELLKNKVWHASLKPGQAVYIPAGHIFFDRTTAERSCGFSIRVLAVKDLYGYSAMKLEGSATALLASRVIEQVAQPAAEESPAAEGSVLGSGSSSSVAGNLGAQSKAAAKPPPRQP